MALPLEKRYAHAFLNVFADVITPKVLASTEALCDYLKKHRRVVFMLKLSVLDDQIKLHGLYELCKRFDLPSPFKKLIDLLQTQHRLPLLPDIVCHLEELYMERNQIYPLTIRSSIELMPDERTPLEKFLAQQLPGTILCTYHTDSRLIAGIRAQSTTYLWEKSVARQLRDIEAALSR